MVHGAMVLLYHGTMRPCFHATMVRWYHGTLVPWYRSHGSVVQWYHGTMEPWYCGTMMVPRYHCTRVPWQASLLEAGGSLLEGLGKGSGEQSTEVMKFSSASSPLYIRCLILIGSLFSFDIF